MIRIGTKLFSQILNNMIFNIQQNQDFVYYLDFTDAGTNRKHSLALTMTTKPTARKTSQRFVSTPTRRVHCKEKNLSSALEPKQKIKKAHLKL